MANRKLPADVNPLLDEDSTPAYEILVERRCLGQTELKVKPDHVGTTNATKPDNLGTLDYAHLRVPLPQNLTGSGIFIKQGARKWPEAYFLMRRSTDGFISATGMFKAAFPWAQVEEETSEKEYIKTLDAASSEEVAGNVWIHPEQALFLADEYGIKTWIEALLDPEPITHGTSDPKKFIASPPTFRTKDMMNGSSKSRSPEAKKSSAADGRRSTRGTGSKASVPRSESPTKKSTRKIAQPTPRKRKGRGKSVEPESEAIDTDAMNGEIKKQEDDNVKIHIESERLPSPDGNDELEHTKVNIEMPAHSPDLALPEDAEGMLEKARAMVAEANQLDGRRLASPSKRKAVEMDPEDEDAHMGPTAKRAKKVELELRKERIKRRALMGIATSLAIGVVVPSFLAFLGS